MTNFTLNLIKNNDLKLSRKYEKFGKYRLEFSGIFASLVLASATSKTSVYRTS